jgi:solute:Na+ symporter, SSS family
MTAQMQVLDWAILGIYLVFVLWVGFALRRRVHTSEEFFQSGHSIPAWIGGLAFMATNLGAQEVIGMAASGAKYGFSTAHFYWLGAIPAMVFLAIFMMPFYYGSHARSVPEYLKLRFDEKTRTLNAVSFAAMTIVSSGVSMYVMGLLLNLILGWDFTFSVSVSAAIVLAYVLLGGLTSAIYNEVIQFFLMVFGFAPLVVLGLIDIGGWAGLQAGLAQAATAQGFAPDAMSRIGGHMGDPQANPMGVEWFGLAMGLGFVLSFGYWCTDFLIVQRAMAAESMLAARRIPLIAAVPKMLFPFLLILPGMIAIALTVAHTGSGFELPRNPSGGYTYDLAMPMLVMHYFPTGLLGLGVTALLASFMSGMAGNVTAFNTVWTYDIYQAHIRRDASDSHYLWVGRASTVVGVLLSVGAAYAATRFNNIMDLLQLVFAFVNAPLLGTFLLGMFWKRTTGHGAFTGLLAGTVAAAAHHGLSLSAGSTPGLKGGWLGTVVHEYPSEMAQNFWTAIWAFAACVVVTVLVSLVSRPRPEEELRGLVYSLTERPREDEAAWFRRPGTLGVVVLIAVVVFNLSFW